MRSVVAAVALVLSALYTPPGAVAQGSSPEQGRATYRIDASHSELTFRIRHLVSRVNGNFRSWSGTITAVPDQWNTGQVEVVIEAASIDTRNARRDDDLRSKNFFEVEAYPTITFRSTSVAVDGTRIRLIGDLTIRDITRPVTLEGEFLGLTGEPPRERIGFEASTTINRLDWGVTWNRAAEGGGVLLGDDVTIAITIAAVRTAGTAR